MNKEKILVTGAKGFLGSQLIKHLSEENFSVVGTTRREIIASDSENLNYIRHDLNNDDEEIYSKLGKPEVLIHLAWDHLNDLNNKSHLEDQLEMHKHFLLKMIQSGVKKIFVSGTCQEYKISEGVCLDEKSPIKPLTKYALAKNKLRLFLEEVIQTYDCKLIWGRLFYIYGENQSENTLYGSFQQKLAAGSPTFSIKNPFCQRDYLKIEMVVKYIVKLIQLQEKIIIVNICSGIPVKISDLVRSWIQPQDTIELKVDIKMALPKHEINSFYGSNEFLKSLI